MLDNKLGIKSEIELANEEERITKINMSQDNFKNIIKKYIEMNIAHSFKKAMERSPVKDLKQVFMKEMDSSYQYEGYNTYSTIELDKN